MEIFLRISKAIKYEELINLRLHSTAGGGLKGAHSCLVHRSQLVGMWKLMATSSCPLITTVTLLSPLSVSASTGGVALSSGFLDSPSPA